MNNKNEKFYIIKTKSRFLADFAGSTPEGTMNMLLMLIFILWFPFWLVKSLRGVEE